MADKKLSPRIVAECRRAARRDPIAYSAARLAVEYNVSRNTMRKALIGETYKDCSEPPITPPNSHPNGKLSRADIDEMKRLRVKGWTYVEIARQFGVSDGTARLAIIGERYKQ